MSIIRKIVLIGLLFSCTQSKLVAQNSVDFFVDTLQQLNASFGMHYNYGSSVIDNQFLNKFIFGGKVTREDKDRVYQKLSNSNRFGGDLNYSLNLEIPLDSFFSKPNISLVLGLENTEHADAEFSSDLFRLAFDGNKQFAGDRIDFGGTNYTYFKYQKFNLGLISHKFHNETLAKEGVIVSIIKAEEHLAITAPRGTFFTEQLGKEMEVDLNYLYNSSDTLNKGFGAFNGYGISTDLFTEIILKNGDRVFLGLEDLGFIHWNSNSIQIEADSTFYYEGLEVSNIFELNDSLLSNISKDSIINRVSNKNDKGDYSIALPTSININYTKVLSEKWKINVGLYHKILANYFPLISTNYYYYFNKNFVAKAHISYGGYGRLNTGLALGKSISKYFNIFVGTNNLETFISQESSYANSGFVGLKAYF